MRFGCRADVADRCRRGMGLLRRMLCVPIGRMYGVLFEKGDSPDVEEDEVVEDEAGKEDGKFTCGRSAEHGVGGGGGGS